MHRWHKNAGLKHVRYEMLQQKFEGGESGIPLILHSCKLRNFHTKDFTQYDKVCETLFQNMKHPEELVMYL